MVCVTSVNIKPSKINIKVGQWYHGAYAEVCPINATCPSVTWRSSNPMVASVNSSSGYIYGNSAGTAVIYAEAQDGSGKRGSCTVTVSQTVKVSSIELSSNRLILEKGTRYTLCASVYPANASNKNLMWCSRGPSIVSVDQNGSVTAKRAGRATIYAAAQDGSGVQGCCTVTVTEDVLISSVEVIPSSKTLYKGQSTYLNAVICPENAECPCVTWSSSNLSVATVNPVSGLVIAQNPGTAVIYATTADGSNLQSCCSITVLSAAIPVSSVTISPSNLSMTVGNKSRLTATVCPDNATDKSVMWWSSEPFVAVVDVDGNVTAQNPGSAVIYAVTTDGSNLQACCSVSVNQCGGTIVLDHPILVYQTRDTELNSFADENATIECLRDDLYYNDMSTLDILKWYQQDGSISQSDLWNVVTGPSGGVHTELISVNQRVDIFKNDMTFWFALGDFNSIILDMIDHFVGNKCDNFTGIIGDYNIYKNASLTEKVKNHSKSIEYIDNIKNVLNQTLTKYKGDITSLKYNPEIRFNPVLRDAQPIVQAFNSIGILQPVFGSWNDRINGFSVCLDSLQGNKIEILSYSLDGNKYHGIMRVTYYDHFGVDKSDLSLEKDWLIKPAEFQGFRQWFILQHFQDLGASVQPKPFITTIEITEPFSGVIN